MAGEEEKLAVSISSGGSPREGGKNRKPEGKKNPPAPPSLLPHHLTLPGGRKGACEELELGLRGPCTGRLAAHLPRSVLQAQRAPRPLSSGRPFLAPAAAALAASPPLPQGSTQERSMPKGAWVWGFSHESGARAWTASSAAGRSVRPARLESVLRMGCERGRLTPSPAGCYLIPGRPGALPTPRSSAPPRAC